MWSKRNGLMFAGILLLAGLVLGACQPQEVVVEVTREVEVVEEVIKEVEVEVPTGGQLITLVARCKGSPPWEEGRCNNLIAAAGAANAALAEAGDERRIDVETIQDDPDWGDYKTEFELASQAGEAPDIIVSGHEHIGDWAVSGIVIDVTDMLGAHSEFDDVIDGLWTSTEFKGRRYGVPQDAEARPMYFSKLLLREMGWSEDEIASLPDRVASGEYTWQDMLDTAEEAVVAGIVEEGNGWWHRPSNGPDFLYYYFGAGGEILGDTDALVFDKDAALKVYELLYSATQERGILSKTRLDGDWTAFKTGISTGENVLFFFEGTWRWPDLALNFVADRGGEDYLFENIGFAPIPAREDGTGKPTTLTHPLVYMISSQSEHPDLALLLLAKTTTKELNTTYAIDSGHLGILKSQSDYPTYTTSKFLSATLPLLEFTTFLPNSPYWSSWSNAYYLGIQAVESGDLTASEAVDVVVDQLQNELGDNVEIVGG
ncbi:MAG: extracellular solute-binding protein [Anaerolineales bacterium]